MIIRGQPCELQAETVKLDKTWSPKDIVGVVRNLPVLRGQPNLDDESGPISPVGISCKTPAKINTPSSDKCGTYNFNYFNTVLHHS